jgi:hypothetical protein
MSETTKKKTYLVSAPQAMMLQCLGDRIVGPDEPVEVTKAEAERLRDLRAGVVITYDGKPFHPEEEPEEAAAPAVAPKATEDAPEGTEVAPAATPQAE